MNDNQAIARGHRAEREYEELGAAFEAVKAALVKTLAETPVGADAKVLKLHMSLQNLEAVRLSLLATVNAGDVARYAQSARDAIAVQGLTRP